jgi:lipase chaperone LimK
MEELVDKILATIKAKKFTDFKTPFFGDPITYPTFDLPAIAVAPVKDLVTARTMGPHGKDRHQMVVRIYLVRNVRDGFNQATNESPVDRSLVRTTADVVAALREEITLGGAVATFVSASVQYTQAVRGREAMRMAQIDALYESLKSR